MANEGFDGGGGGLTPTHMSLTKYEVNIDGLADFAAFIEREVATNIRPAVDGIAHDAWHGQRWGRDIRSQEVQDARSVYLSVQTGAIHVAQAFQSEAEILAEIVRKLITTYGSANELASMTDADIGQVFSSVRADYEARQHAPIQHGFTETA